jgi:DMSO/TMAO reductase YedYZ molybdopterin-dependent catalytic subunit
MDEKEKRVVEARMKLRERFLEKMKRTPAQADAHPPGEGPKNRHGMPRLPPGQTETVKWPVLDLGRQPRIALDKWQLVIDGVVEKPVTLSWADFQGLEQVEDVSDFHCVTTWSLLDQRWTGVRVDTLLALAGPTDKATHLMIHGYDGYSTNLPLEEALKPDVLLVHRWNGAPLPIEHGGPVRMITPQLWAWKGSKWVSRLELLPRDVRGYWEMRGYSNTAHPWRDDRYS